LIPYLFLDLFVVYPLKRGAHETCKITCDALGVHLNRSPLSVDLSMLNISVFMMCVCVDVPRLRSQCKNFERFEEGLGGWPGVELR
jgi:hypothetical protein